MPDTPSSLTDEAIDRAQALGFEMHEFLVRRRAARQSDHRAEVDVGPRLRDMLASLERKVEDD